MDIIYVQMCEFFIIKPWKQHDWQLGKHGSIICLSFLLQFTSLVIELSEREKKKRWREINCWPSKRLIREVWGQICKKSPSDFFYLDKRQFGESFNQSEPVWIIFAKSIQTFLHSGHSEKLIIIFSSIVRSAVFCFDTTCVYRNISCPEVQMVNPNIRPQNVI